MPVGAVVRFFGGERTMGRVTGRYGAAVAVVAMFGLVGCETTGTQQETVGTLLGGVVGGVLGAQVGGGTGRLMATGIGAVAGAVIGREIARYLEQGDQERLAQSTGQTIATGETGTWRNPDTGVSGRTEVTREEQRSEQVQVRVLKDRVDELPPIDLIGAPYVSSGNVNVRGGPGTDYRVVDSLRAGEAVQVVGRVQGRDWYMIARDGAASGFVSATLLSPAPDRHIQTAAAPSGELVTASANRTCRTVRQEVTLADGSVQEELVTACSGPDGWQVVSA